MKLLNVGCGGTHHPEWTNVDLVAADPAVTEVDIRRGLPFADASFDAVYHSHVLEHLPPDAGKRLLADCYRVLKPTGVLRVAVPDLEGIARAYIATVDDAIGAPDCDRAKANHDWMTLELIDQMVRSRSGGAMAPLMRDPNTINLDFIRSRLGNEVFGNGRSGRKTVFSRLKRFGMRLRKHAASAAVTLIDGQLGRRAYLEGRFRQAGEIHCWMYDRVSLEQTLNSVGFHQIQVVESDQSRIPEFERYSLDRLNHRPRKPDSLFMESTKPIQSGAVDQATREERCNVAA